MGVDSTTDSWVTSYLPECDFGQRGDRVIRNIIWTIFLVLWTLVLLKIVLFVLFIIYMDLTYDGGPL